MIILIYLKQGIAYSFIKEKQNTLTLQSVQNIPTCDMYWTQRMYWLLGYYKKSIKIPFLIVNRILTFQSMKD